MYFSLLLTGSIRFKGLNFEETGLGFELPKQLAVSNIAVRILHTRYDHLSLLARMAHLRIHTPSHRYLSGSAPTTANTTITKNIFTAVVMLVILTMFSLLCVLVFPHLFGPRSLAGGEEVPTDIDEQEQGGTKGEEEVKEDDEQQRVDEEVQSIQGFDGRKVR